MDDSERPERPGPDATSAEIAEWMEKDFGRAVADGVANADDEDDPDDDHEVVEVEILNHERGEVVGTIDTDGNLETESEALRNVSQEYLEEGVPVLVPTIYENEDGETVHADVEVMVSREPRDSCEHSLTNSRVRLTATPRHFPTCLFTS